MSQNVHRVSTIGGITCTGDVYWRQKHIVQQYIRIDDIDSSDSRWLTSWRIIIDHDEKWKVIVKGTISMRYCSEFCDSWHYSIANTDNKDMSFRLIVV